MAFGLEPDGSTQKSHRLPLLPLGLTSRVPLESAWLRSVAVQALRETAFILPWGLSALRRFQSRAATCAGSSTIRLCSALGVSHPLDALLRPKPFRPCFMPVTPLSFCLQRVSPPSDRFASRRSNPSCRFPAAPTIVRTLRFDRRTALQPRLQGSEPSGDPCRPASPVSRSAEADPLLAFAPPGISPFGTRPRASTGSPLMGFGSPPTGEPAVVLPALQSLKEPKVGLPLSSAAVPPEVSVLVVPPPKQRFVSDPRG